MSIKEKRDKVEVYCDLIDCNDCVLDGKDWLTPFEDILLGKKRHCLAISDCTEEELDKALSMIHSDKIEKMREKIKIHCDSKSDCFGCPLFGNPVPCYENDKYVEENYNLIFDSNNMPTEPCKIFEYENDPVNRPSHYTDGKIEVIDFIQDKKLGFCLGNAIKYIARAGKKDPDKTIEDLKKARWYIDRQIKALEEAN